MAINFFNSLAVDTNVLYVDAINDRVGIGTSSPSTKLEVNGGTASNTAKVLVAGNDAIIKLGSNGAGGPHGLQFDYESATNPDGMSFYYRTGPEQITFEDSTGVLGNKVMVIGRDGNVGIGTSSPSFPLEVDGGTGDGVKIKAGNTLNDDSFLIANSSNATLFVVNGAGNAGIGTTNPINGGGNAKWITIDGVSGSIYSGGVIYSIGGSAKAYHYVESDYLVHQGQSNVGHKFVTNGTTERMRITSSGNVGINQTSPSSFFANASQLVIGDGSTSRGMTIYGSSAGDSQIFFADGVTGDQQYRGIFRYEHSSDAMVMFTSATERMRIGPAGQIGIGGANYGTSGQVLTSNGSGSAPSWQNASGSSNWTLSGNDIYNNNSGNVRIGTTNTSAYKLDVDGTVRLGHSATDYTRFGSYGTLLSTDTHISHNLYFSGSWQVISSIVPSSSIRLGTTSSNEIQLQFAAAGNTAASTQVYFTSSGIGQATGSFRAPLFYDSNNTSYYLDPANSTTSAVLNGKVGIGTTSPISKFQVISATFPQVRINDETNGGESGIRFRSKGTGVDLHGDIFVDGTGTETGRMGFRVPYTGAERMTILSSGNVGIGTASPGYKLEVNGTAKADEFVSLVNTSNSGITRDWTIIGTGDRGAALEVADISGAKYAIYAGGYDLTFGKHVSSNNTYTTAMAIYAANATDTSPYVQATHSFRAPIFYDSNNTGYYTDPAGTSNIQKLIVNTYGTGVTRQLTIKEDGDTDNSMGQYPGAWTSALNIQSNDNSTYLWLSPLTSNIPRVQTNYGQLDFYTGSNTNRALHLSGTTARSAVFYDIDNTNYYLNPADSNLSLKAYGEICNSNYAEGNLNAGSLNIGRTDTNYVFGGQSNWPSDVRLGILANCANDWEFGIHDSGTSVESVFLYQNSNGLITMGRDLGWGSTPIVASNSFRAPIFYDSNNTAYYTDPANVSVLNRVVAGTTSTSNSGSTLHVTGTATSSNPYVHFNGSNGGNYGGIGVRFNNIAYGAGAEFVRTSPYDGSAIRFMYQSSQVGQINIGTTSTAYLTTSDYRLKENVIELTGGIERVKQLQPKRFNFIDDEDTVDGFIAHEAQEVVPESVNGEKDELLPNGEPVYQGIDQAKLVPLLTAALKEAIAKIEDLETRIQILENQ